MPWAKNSDTSAMHPVVLAPMAFVDWEPVRFTAADLVNLLAGIFHRAAVQSAGYTTDYVVTAGVLANTAGDNWRHWTTLMERAGYLVPMQLDGGEPAWRLIDDPEHLVHIRLREELEWERQRRADNGNPNLVIPVRLRDGDGCRYCGCIVVWGVQQGGRGGTYDHRRPGQKALSPDDLRVACRSCNSRRKDHLDADEWCPPLPAPVTPHYGAKTVDLLAEHGHQVRRSKTPRSGRLPGTATRATQRPGAQPDPAPAPRTDRDPAASRTPQPATRPSAGHRDRTTPRPGGQPDPAPGDPAPSRSTPVPAPPPDRDPAASRTPQPATRRNAGHRDRTNQARTGAQPDRAQHPASPNSTSGDQHKRQDQRPLANPSNRLAAELDSPGRVGTGAHASTPTPTSRNRSKPRRGRRGRPQPPAPRPPQHPSSPPLEQP